MSDNIDQAKQTDSNTANAKIDLSEFDINMGDNPNMRTHIAVIGVGATGSSFMMLLAHYLKNYSRNHVYLYDFDNIEAHNYNVSLYTFTRPLGVSMPSNKVRGAYRILMKLTEYNEMTNKRDRNYNDITLSNQKIDERYLSEVHKDNPIDYIFVFTDNNESRHEIAKYHMKNPKSIVFDCRVGSYDQYEVYFSNNPSKYMQTIYFKKDGKTPRSIDNNTNVCLEDRMNFSVAMMSASMIMNLFIKFLRGNMTNDFKHIMIGNDYLGEVKGYE